MLSMCVRGQRQCVQLLKLETELGISKPDGSRERTDCGQQVAPMARHWVSPKQVRVIEMDSETITLIAAR